MSNAVCIKTFQNTNEAEMAKSILESNNIHAMVEADNVGGLMGNIDLTGGVRLLVLEELAKRALEVLENPDQE